MAAAKKPAAGSFAAKSPVTFLALAPLRGSPSIKQPVPLRGCSGIEVQVGELKMTIEPAVDGVSIWVAGYPGGSSAPSSPRMSIHPISGTNFYIRLEKPL